MSEKLLNSIALPADLRKLPESELDKLASELREALIQSVSITGGHLGAGLGVVELTIALHYLFDTPNDRLIWDVGHQAYPHKMLTGRRHHMGTLRQKGGLSGFTRRDESEYDPFGTAHSSTSISAGLGMATARDLAGGKHHVVCVIGDGALSAGLAFEGLNNTGASSTRLIVILNDNDMSISRPSGAISAYLSRLYSSRPYLKLRKFGLGLVRPFPEAVRAITQRIERYVRGLWTGGTLFEELGFYYVGPVDGHRLEHLLPVLRNIRDSPIDGPIFVHVRTQKGKGYAPAEAAPDKLHGVSKFNIVTGKPEPKSGSNLPDFTRVFSDQLIKEAKTDDRIVAITAAMPSGTGLEHFVEQFPERCFDVGIAEQHAVTFAAGLATEGYRPFCAIYSTFLQRAWDQIVHDVAIQSLPVRFAIDRAGFVGADGQTHCGAFDLATLGSLPGMVLMAPSDEAELQRMVRTAVEIDDRPSAIRYPRGQGVGADLLAVADALALGKGRILKRGGDIAILSLGALMVEAEKAEVFLARDGISVTLADARFLKPLDTALIQGLAESHDLLVTIEEAACGFGDAVLRCLATGGLSRTTSVHTFAMPDRFLDHATRAEQLQESGLDADSIYARIKALFHHARPEAKRA